MNEGGVSLSGIGIGEVVRCIGVGQVLASSTDAFAPGDLAMGFMGWQEYAVVAPDGALPATRLDPGTDPTVVLSVLGVTGLSAWFGMYEIGSPQPGETVVVSGAAGATGSVAAQLAKLTGCRVVGIAGGPEKCQWLRTIGLDVAVDYTKDLGRQLDEACPNGIDVFFDNVGGGILETVLNRIAIGARIVLCGAISGYNDIDPGPGPRNLFQLIIRRGRMQGFIIFDYASRFPEAMADLRHRVATGELQWRVDVVDGLAAAPTALNRLFTGANKGKLLVKLADPS
jgi:NADPH-dependent curcumin reductase CurA